MKFEELKKSLANNTKNNYLIQGSDMFLCDNAVRLIEESLNIDMPEFNISKFGQQDIDFADVVQSLLTPAAFSTSKLVVVDLSNKYTKIKNIEELKKYLKEGKFDNILVIKVCDNIESIKGLENKYFETVECSELPRDIAVKLITLEAKKKDRTITPSAINKVLEYTNGNMSACMNELVKLVNYADSEIAEDDVLLLVARNLDYKIYELTENLAKKNINKVYEILNDLKGKKNGYQGLIGLIYTHFRRLLHIAITKLSIAEYADLFGIKEYAVKKLIEQSSIFKPRKLKEICDTCIDLEYKMKTSQITPVNAVDMLVLKIVE